MVPCIWADGHAAFLLGTDSGLFVVPWSHSADLGEYPNATGYWASQEQMPPLVLCGA